MSYAYNFFSDEVSQRSVKLQSIDFGIHFKNSFDLCFVLKREICNIENEGLGEFLQGYGTPLFVSSEYSLNYSAVTIICISPESYNFRSWNVISGRFLFYPDWWELWWKFELTHKQKNSKPSLRQRSGEIDNPNRAAQCAFTLIFLIGREALYSDIKGFATHASFRRICWRNCIGS